MSNPLSLRFSRLHRKQQPRPNSNTDRISSGMGIGSSGKKVVLESDRSEFQLYLHPFLSVPLVS